MECYHFCQQCEDYFATAGATGLNRTPFAASFLRDRMSFRWHQHKLRSRAVAPLPWNEFKAFLRKSLGDSRSFVDTIWSRIRRDSQYQQEEVQDWASHLISNPSLSSLMLTGLQKSPISFGSSKSEASATRDPPIHSHDKLCQTLQMWESTILQRRCGSLLASTGDVEVFKLCLSESVGIQVSFGMAEFPSLNIAGRLCI